MTQLLLFAGLFAMVLPFYVGAMSPSVSVGDSGEFIAAAVTLALPHAPSYPLFTLLGKCVTILMPFGHLAYRVNLLSALCGVVVAALTGAVAFRLGLGIFASIVAALTLAFSNALWEPSVTAEVFTLNACVSLLVVWVMLLKEKPLRVRAACAAFVFGLGLGNHHTLVLIVPALFLIYWSERSEAGLGIRAMVKEAVGMVPLAALFFVLGFSIYLFLPIRSRGNPVLDWSNPETLSQFIRVVTRADYGSMSLTLGEPQPRTIASSFNQVKRYAHQTVVDFSWAGVAAFLMGWAVWFWKDRKRALAFAAWTVASGPGFLILGNMPFDSQSTGILPRFYLLPALPLALSVGWSAHYAQRFGKTSFAFLLIPAALLWNAHGHRSFARNDYAALDYGRNILRTLPPDSALFMDGGDDTFYTLAYLTLAERRRPDLRVHDRGGLIFTNPYGPDFRRILKSEKEERRRRVEGSVLGSRPLYYATFDRRILPGARLVPRGLLYEALPEGNDVQRPSPWPLYVQRGLYEWLPERPYRLRALLPIYPLLNGLDPWNLPLLRRAAAFGTDILWLKSNIEWECLTRGYLLTQQGRDRDAEELYRFALESNPNSAQAAANLGVLVEKRGDMSSAERWYQYAQAVDPSSAEAHYNLGALYWKQGRWAEVVREFEQTLNLKPEHPAASKYLEAARRRAAEVRP